MYLQNLNFGAEVLGVDSSPAACACARANGVHALLGDLFEPVPSEWAGTTDLVTAVAPYVPTASLTFLSRDAIAFEGVTSYDGGMDGLDVTRRIIREAPRYLRAGGSLVCEVGGDQRHQLQEDLASCHFSEVIEIKDLEDDLRGFAARWTPS
jgi:release factor glutamine methyltransferase